MTHSDLVRVAARWLKSKAVTCDSISLIRCPIVFTEMVTLMSETPDAIGFFQSRFSILIECKASRSDFLADKKKRFRVRPELGVGDYRYFMTVAGLISIAELPERWGLLEVSGKNVTVVQKAGRQQKKAMSNEMVMLASAVRRLQSKRDLKPVVGASEFRKLEAS